MSASTNGVRDSQTEANRILRPRDLRDRLGLSLATVWRLRRRGELPEPIRLSPGCVGWRATDIDQWLVARQASTGRRSGSEVRRAPRLPDTSSRMTGTGEKAELF